MTYDLYFGLLNYINCTLIQNLITDKHPDIATAKPCWMGEDHQNQEGATKGSECNPFGGHGWLIDTTN